MVKVITTKPLDGEPAGVEREFDHAEFEMLKGFGAVREIGDESLRSDGPTVEEYVAAGYQATGYPPSGYASLSSEGEIAAAIATQASPSLGSSNAGAGDGGGAGAGDVGTDAAPDVSGEKTAPDVENKAAPEVVNKAARKPANKAN
ncbi:hypothetical protein [Aureimonas sp. Leaf324]|uniref:hypothetical protein n=1 Tax=Aureimonas sp. Leaf324 TaxID=1736336 RepID=UPI0006F9906E|nr:hypothetical protein [Aureimonas sp. Leaf324]KQQ81947.1 hypothetical protein ASF65_07785 [Aureimonas sp. Leaf324]